MAIIIKRIPNNLQTKITGRNILFHELKDWKFFREETCKPACLFFENLFIQTTMMGITKESQSIHGYAK
jgi:hypothetical protein